MPNSRVQEPVDPSSPLRLELALEGEEGDRWRVRVGMRPTEGSVHIDGATISLCDVGGRELGPSVVLPVAGEIADYVELHSRVQGPRPLRAGMALRCTVFFSSGRDPQVAEEPVAPRRGFPAWLRGECAMVLPPEVKGEALSDAALADLREAWPLLFPETPDEDAQAFDVFKDDLLASMDLEEHDSVTEEILRMLRED
ncbi:MAG: hypothetical protein ABIO70_12745 [Pseudomonadota bacterium]